MQSLVKGMLKVTAVGGAIVGGACGAIYPLYDTAKQINDPQYNACSFINVSNHSTAEKVGSIVLKVGVEIPYFAVVGASAGCLSAVTLPVSLPLALYAATKTN